MLIHSKSNMAASKTCGFPSEHEFIKHQYNHKHFHIQSGSGFVYCLKPLDIGMPTLPHIIVYSLLLYLWLCMFQLTQIIYSYVVGIGK